MILLFLYFTLTVATRKLKFRTQMFSRPKTEPFFTILLTLHRTPKQIEALR